MKGQDDTAEQMSDLEPEETGDNRQANERPLQQSPKDHARATHADTLVWEAQRRRKQLSFLHTLAYNLQSNDANSVEQRAAKVGELLKEDSQRNPPWTDVGFEMEVRLLIQDRPQKKQQFGYRFCMCVCVS
jgi:hypothetical protein